MVRGFTTCANRLRPDGTSGPPGTGTKRPSGLKPVHIGYRLHRHGFMRVCVVSRLIVVWGFVSVAQAEPGFVESFADDPVAAGRWRVHDGDATRFRYQPQARSLLAHYDTLEPTARLVRPLCRPMRPTDSFEFTATFRIHSDGFVADSRRHAQIAFGFMNSATTGTDRVYGLNGQGSYDLVSFDYYPNISLFGGPSAGATVITTDTGAGFASAIRFDFGPETEMSDQGEGLLPLDEWLTASIAYDGPRRRATLRISRDGQALTIGAIGTGFEDGGPDGDPTTITTELGAGLFSADSFGLLLWHDTSATFATLVADVEFRSITVAWSAGGDLDDNGEVNTADVALFIVCRTGPHIPLSDSACAPADLDCDGDVDQSDYGLLQAALAEAP